MSSANHHICGAEFLKDKTCGLSEPGDFKSLGQSAGRSAKIVNKMTAQISGWQYWRETANRVKAHVLANLDKLLVEFERNISARGVEVLYAEDAQAANRLVIDIAKKYKVKNVVKSKTMVSEEMALNHVLADEGIRAVETDLGEYLVQLADERPVHIVTPAIHLSAEDCGRLFEKKLKEPYTAEHRELTDIARRHLREEYIKADMGISGVNFAMADTGTIAIIENEGNAGLSTSAPPVHVALMGIEKIIPSVEYLPLFLNLLARSGTGQKLTSYTHLIDGPAPGRKMYLIIIDNGRTNDLADPATRSSLGCLRCGACLNNCPVYQRVGGWAYGWVYPGPIGSIVTSQLLGYKKAGKLPFASSLLRASLQRGVSREDRYSAPTGAFTQASGTRIGHDAENRRGAHVEGVGHGHERSHAIPAHNVGCACRNPFCQVPALAPVATGRLDTRPRGSQAPRRTVPQPLAEERKKVLNKEKP